MEFQGVVSVGQVYLGVVSVGQVYPGAAIHMASAVWLLGLLVYRSVAYSSALVPFAS